MTLAAELAGAFMAGLACALVVVGLLARWAARHPGVLMERMMKRAAKQRAAAQTSTGGDGSIRITRNDS